MTVISEDISKRAEDISRRTLKNRDLVQSAFESVAAFDAVQGSTRLGAEHTGAVRKRMWSMLTDQVESGLGGPSEEQLALLWSKYDGNGDGTLSRVEIQQIMIDYAGATMEEVSA